MDRMRTLTRTVVCARSEAAEQYCKRTTAGFDTDKVISCKAAKGAYPPVELERKLFAFLVGSNREQDQPDQKCALVRATAEQNNSTMYERRNYLTGMLEMLVQGIEARLEREPDFAQDREVNMRQLDGELTNLILAFVLPTPALKKAPALKKEPAIKKALTALNKKPALKNEPGEPRATGKRGAVDAQPVLKEEPGQTSKRARRGK